MDAVAEFETAERRVMEHYGLTYESTFVQLSAPRAKIRVISVGKGPPIVLVHGGLGYASQWAPLMAALPGYRLLAVDRPGYGLSDPYIHRRDHLRNDAVAFMESLLDALYLDRAPIIANSMGGLWTFWLALDHPDRVSTMCQIGCPATILDTSAPPPMRLLSVRGLNRLMVKAAPLPGARSVLRQLGEAHAAETLPPAYLDCMEAASELPAWLPASLSLLEATLRLGGSRTPLRADELCRVSHPTLFIWGIHDPFGGPSSAQHAATAMPNAELRLLDAGHLPWLEHSAEVASAILGQLEPKRW